MESKYGNKTEGIPTCLEKNNLRKGQTKLIIASIS